MAILSHAEYLHRWTAPAPNGFGQTICPPCYHEYLQREVYFNDYLDLFRNVITFNRIPHLDRFYVPITGCQILGVLDIPEHELYTINIDGIVYLLVDYDYPWTLEELKKKRCIKYVLIAEACPKSGANFIYNINEILSQGYLKESYNAQYDTFGPEIQWSTLRNIDDKKNKLLDLATRGVLLVDLFPFAIKFTTTLRKKLNRFGVTDYFFNGLENTFSVISRLNNLIQANIFCNDFNKRINSVFIAPTTISYKLASSVNNYKLTTLFFKLGMNEQFFNPPHNLLKPNDHFYCEILAGTRLNGIELPANRENNLYSIMVPRYSCTAYCGSGTVPHSLFITNALL